MSYSSDEFDGEIRLPLYALLTKLIEAYQDTDSTQLDGIYEKLVEATGLADDYRVDLMDDEGELDKHEDES